MANNRNHARGSKRPSYGRAIARSKEKSPVEKLEELRAVRDVGAKAAQAGGSGGEGWSELGRLAQKYVEPVAEYGKYFDPTGTLALVDLGFDAHDVYSAAKQGNYGQAILEGVGMAPGVSKVAGLGNYDILGEGAKGINYGQAAKDAGSQVLRDAQTKGLGNILGQGGASPAGSENIEELQRRSRENFQRGIADPTMAQYQGLANQLGQQQGQSLARRGLGDSPMAAGLSTAQRSNVLGSGAAEVLRQRAAMEQQLAGQAFQQQQLDTAYQRQLDRDLAQNLGQILPGIVEQLPGLFDKLPGLGAEQAEGRTAPSSLSGETFGPPTPEDQFRERSPSMTSSVEGIPSDIHFTDRRPPMDSSVAGIPSAPPAMPATRKPYLPFSGKFDDVYYPPEVGDIPPGLIEQSGLPIRSKRRYPEPQDLSSIPGYKKPPAGFAWDQPYKGLDNLQQPDSAVTEQRPVIPTPTTPTAPVAPVPPPQAAPTAQEVPRVPGGLSVGNQPATIGERPAYLPEGARRRISKALENGKAVAVDLSQLDQRGEGEVPVIAIYRRGGFLRQKEGEELQPISEIKIPAELFQEAQRHFRSNTFRIDPLEDDFIIGFRGSIAETEGITLSDEDLTDILSSTTFEPKAASQRMIRQAFRTPPSKTKLEPSLPVEAAAQIPESKMAELLGQAGEIQPSPPQLPRPQDWPQVDEPYEQGRRSIPGHQESQRVQPYEVDPVSLLQGVPEEARKTIANYGPIIDRHVTEPETKKVINNLIFRESSGRKDVISSAGARGVVQLMPRTAIELGLRVDLDKNGKLKKGGVDERTDPAKAIPAGIKYLEQQKEAFGDMRLALAAYNYGPGNVGRLIKEFQQQQGAFPGVGLEDDVALILEELPSSVRLYVKRIYGG